MKGCNSRLNFITQSYLNVGRMTCSYSFVVDSWTIAKAGCKHAANTSAALISCCKQGQTCCHQSFYTRNKRQKKKFSWKKIKKSFCFEASFFNLKFALRWKVIKVRRYSFIFHVFFNLLAQFSGRIYSNRQNWIVFCYLWDLFRWGFKNWWWTFVTPSNLKKFDTSSN